MATATDALLSQIPDLNYSNTTELIQAYYRGSDVTYITADRDNYSGIQEVYNAILKKYTLYKLIEGAQIPGLDLGNFNAFANKYIHHDNANVIYTCVFHEWVIKCTSNRQANEYYDDVFKRKRWFNNDSEHVKYLKTLTARATPVLANITSLSREDVEKVLASDPSPKDFKKVVDTHELYTKIQEARIVGSSGIEYSEFVKNTMTFSSDEAIYNAVFVPMQAIFQNIEPYEHSLYNGRDDEHLAYLNTLDPTTKFLEHVTTQYNNYNDTGTCFINAALNSILMVPQLCNLLHQKYGGTVPMQVSMKCPTGVHELPKHLSAVMVSIFSNKTRTIHDGVNHLEKTTSKKTPPNVFMQIKSSLPNIDARYTACVVVKSLFDPSYFDILTVVDNDVSRPLKRVHVNGATTTCSTIKQPINGPSLIIIMFNQFRYTDALSSFSVPDSLDGFHDVDQGEMFRLCCMNITNTKVTHGVSIGRCEGEYIQFDSKNNIVTHLTPEEFADIDSKHVLYALYLKETAGGGQQRLTVYELMRRALEQLARARP